MRLHAWDSMTHAWDSMTHACKGSEASRLAGLCMLLTGSTILDTKATSVPRVQNARHGETLVKP